MESTKMRIERLRLLYYDANVHNNNNIGNIIIVTYIIYLADDL